MKDRKKKTRDSKRWEGRRGGGGGEEADTRGGGGECGKGGEWSVDGRVQKQDKVEEAEKRW